MQWPTSAGGTLERSSACFEATAPSSIAERSFSVPPKVPKPVRTPERNTTSVLEPWVFIGGKLHVRRGEYRGDRGRAVGRGVASLKRPRQARLRAPLQRVCKGTPAYPPTTLDRHGQTPSRPKGLPAVASSLAPTTTTPRPREVR